MATSPRSGTVVATATTSGWIWPEPEPEPEPTVEPEREWWTGKVEQPELPFPPSPDPTEPVVIRSPYRVAPGRITWGAGASSDDLVLTWGDSTVTLTSSELR